VEENKDLTSELLVLQVGIEDWYERLDQDFVTRLESIGQFVSEILSDRLNDQ